MELADNGGNNVDFDEPEANPEGFFSDLTSQNACSVRVAVRVRPLIGRELVEGGTKTCVDVDHIQNKLQIGEKNFQFDRVFSSDSEQEEIFDVCSRNLVLGCFAGYNATILAYGQTGSGKTHTMGTGSTSGLTEDQVGIVPRVFQFIFEELDRRKKQSSLSEFTIKIAFLELYNEELHDLLDPASISQVDRITGKSTKELQIKEKNGNIYVQGLKEEQVSSKEECLQLLNKGISHRTTSATLMNEGSSRSHAIFTISIEQKIIKELDVAEAAIDVKEGLPGQQEEQITAKFHFVDLAGSERLKRTGATGQLMKEGISINKGLLCLGNVISALTNESQKDKHIPYRDSKLTRILQDSLGGNSRTTMIACVSPAESNYEESLNSIKYASRARNIKNKPVVNRDPNSLLIESLRQQISSLQGEIKEYQALLKNNNVDVPENFTEQVQKRMEETKKVPQKSSAQPTNNEGSSLMSQGTINFSEIRDLKIKLSRKEKELKEVQDQYQQLILKLAQKDEEISQLSKERDILRLKNEIINEHLQKNNLQIDSSSDSASGATLSLIDEYKEKLEKMEKQLEKKNLEVQSKNKQVAELQLQTITDEGVLRKHLEENQRLKKQLKKFEEQQTSNSYHHVQPSSPMPQSTKSNPRFKLNLQALNGGIALKKEDQISSSDQKSLHQKRKSQLDNIMINAEDLEQKFINNLTNQLECLFQPSLEEDMQPLHSARSMKSKSILDSDNLARQSSMDDIINGQPFNSIQDSNNLLDEENPVITPNIIEEKEKILGTVKNNFKQMQNEYVELVKHQYEKRIQEIEKDLSQMDNEKQATLKKITDSKQIQQIEVQYKQKMDDLQKQLTIFKEKEKTQENVKKQINVQENKIKNLEDDITKIKKTKDLMEKQMKTDIEKFSHFKKNVSKELTNAKKVANEKEKEVIKLKSDLKKTDQLAQSKISMLKGFQKKVNEDRMRRELEKKEEYDKKGIDIDRIKDWINENTDRMLRHQELTEQLQKKQDEKERIEDEMLQDGDKLTGLMLQKERKEILKAQLELEEEPDEGKILELEEELYQLFMEMGNITENLDSHDQTLSFINSKINSITEEVITLDIDNIQPLKFHGLQSVDAARVTLQTFFCVLLDINIYKRDLENKCIEQDEWILDLNEQIRLLQLKVEELIQNASSNILPIPAQSHQAADQVNRVNNASKDKAIKTIVNTLDGFVEYQDLKNLNLTPNEQNSLTKLSLSKIVSNLKQKLKEEETKNQSLSHKLEQAMSDKEQFRLRYDNLRNKKKNDQILKEPLQFKDQQQQEKDQKFSSLASARANRRQQLSQAQDGSVDQSQDPNATASTTISAIKPSIPQSQNAHQFKYKSRVNPSQKQQTEDQVNQLQSKPQFGRNKETVQSQQSMKLNQVKKQLPLERKSSSQEKTVFQRLQKTHTLSSQNKSPRKIDSVSQNTDPPLNIAPKKMMNQTRNELLPPPKQASSKSNLPVPSFKDRRNQRKLEHNDDNTAKIEPEMVQEIDNIKKETFLITHNQSHMERRQSRARAFSKKIHDRGLSGGHQQMGQMQVLNEVIGHNMSNIKDFEENDDEESPRISRSPKKLPADLGSFEQMSSNLEDESMIQALLSPSKDARNKWSHEELAQLENYGHKIIGCDFINDKFILIFENFLIREVHIETLEEIAQVNLFEVNGQMYQGQIAVDFAIDKESGLLAVADQQTVHIFDYSDSYQQITKIDVENTQRVLFCQFNVVVLVNFEDAQVIVSYQVEDGYELASFEVNSCGQKPLISTDNQFIYFAYGITMGKLNMPDLRCDYTVETEHLEAITDFSISQNAIVTTSRDSVRCHELENGQECVNALDGLDCDFIETQDDFIFMRVGYGAAVLVWRHYPMKDDLALIEEIPLEVPQDEILDFKMRGNILARFGNGVKYDLLLMITSMPEVLLINALKHKPLSE